MVSHGRFGIDELRGSLETSLRELRTDHVDVLLLHECQPDDIHDGILTFLSDLVTEGTIGSFGIATDRAAATTIARGTPALAEAVQVPDSVVDERLPDDLGAPLLTHSVLGRGLGVLRRTLADPSRGAAWSTALGVDVTAEGVLEKLMLEGALARNPEGTVLISSRNPNHIATNAEIGRAGPVPGRTEIFRRLVDEARQSGELDSSS